MIQIVIAEQGRQLSPQDLTTPEQLRAAIELSRSLIAQCERRLAAMTPAKAEVPKKNAGVPYL
jgi:hypothetical protein